MSESILIKNGTIVTMDEADSIVRGDLLVRDLLSKRAGFRVEQWSN